MIVSTDQQAFSVTIMVKVREMKYLNKFYCLENQAND